MVGKIWERETLNEHAAFTSFLFSAFARRLCACPSVTQGSFSRPEECVAPSGAETHQLIVSAGSGLAGEPLLRTAIEAHRLLREAEDIEMKVITGPFQERVPCRNWSQSWGIWVSPPCRLS